MLFISHATKDNDRINAFVARLNAAGIADLWIDHQHGADRGITVGDDWQRELEDGLKKCDRGVFVITPASIDSDWCRREILRIKEVDRKPLYPVLLDPIPESSFPLLITGLHYADLSKDYEAGLRTLINALVGESELDAADPTVSVGKRITGDIDPLLKIPMFGRDTDLDIAHAKVKSMPLFIVGIGGLGKSRLAYALLDQDDWSEAIWHRASETSNEEDVLFLLRQHFDLDATANEDAILKTVRAAKRLLVVIDNAESVTDSAKTGYIRLIDRLHTSGAAICVTSREIWREVKVKGMFEPSQLSPEAATQLVSAFAKLFDIDAPPASVAADLAAAARYHPRLIELAVGKLSYMPASAVIMELRALKSAETQDSLTEMIGNTVRQMTSKHSDAPLNALRRLAVCRGGFTAEAGQAILMTESEGFYTFIRTLTDYRFVRFQSDRYTIDDLVREAVSEDASAHRPHYDFYRAFAQHLDESLDHLKYVKMDVERNNLETAFEWAIETDIEAAYQIASACTFYLSNRGLPLQRLDWFLRLQKAIAHGSEELQANIQYNLGIIYAAHPFGKRGENLHLAIESFQGALQYFTPEVAPQRHARITSSLAAAYRNTSEIENRAENLKRAIELYQHALTYQPPSTSSRDYGTTQTNLAYAYWKLSEVEDREGNLQRAIAAYNTALSHRTEQGEQLDYATTLNNLGLAYRSMAEIEDASNHLQRAIEMLEKALVYRTAEASPRSYALTETNLGSVYLNFSALQNPIPNLHRAIEAFKNALIYRTPGIHPLGYAFTQNYLGLAYHSLGKYENSTENYQRAIKAFEEALVYRTAEASPLYYAVTQNNLGHTLQASGDLSGAIHCWREAERYFRQMDAPNEADVMLEQIADAETLLDTTGDAK